MADRIAVFDHGKVKQVGTPEQIYKTPNSRFVADFVGSSNVLPPDFVERHVGEKRWASLRPEAVRLVAEGPDAIASTPCFRLANRVRPTASPSTSASPAITCT